MNGVILIKMEAFVEDDERKKVIEQFKVDIQEYRVFPDIFVASCQFYLTHNTSFFLILYHVQTIVKTSSDNK